jgi:hypothetical protein
MIGAWLIPAIAGAAISTEAEAILYLLEARVRCVTTVAFGAA